VYQYCNIMYVVATHIIETLSGRWIGDFLREKIWRPLGMEETFFGNADVEEHGVLDRFAKGYRWDEDASRYVEVPWPVQPEGAGAGEMISTVCDYARFLRCMILKSGPFSGEGHEELVRPRMIVGEDPRPFHSHALYALGWEVETYHGETVIGHGGSTCGFGSSMLYLPRLRWGVVVFGNSDGAYVTNLKICWTMIDDLLDVPVEKRFDWDEFGREDEEEQECKTREELYPKIPEITVPLTLPLEAYAGSYWQEGWGTLVVEFRDGKLVVDATDRL
jgi:CubicO group peptidase (beta-lactamase class C family)